MFELVGSKCLNFDRGRTEDPNQFLAFKLFMSVVLPIGLIKFVYISLVRLLKFVMLDWLD